jgi:hypothetical protein
MKKLIATITLCVAASGCVMHDVSRDVFSGIVDVIGPPAKVITRMESLSYVKDYAGIYHLLGSEYQAGVSEKVFVGACERLSWKFVSLHPGTLYVQNHFAWMAVHGVIHTDGGAQKVFFNTVAFFGEERGEWKLVTFPFPGAPVPEMGVTPRWIVDAAKEYGTE